MKSFIRFFLLFLVIAGLVHIYTFVTDIKEQKISVEIIKKRVSEKALEVSGKKVICPYCSGFGKAGSGASAKTCQICRGRGYGIIWPSESEIVICPNPPVGCGGMGYILKDGKVKICNFCGGIGYTIKIK